jgi:predicted nucleic acid-binding Zn finger protein
MSVSVSKINQGKLVPTVEGRRGNQYEVRTQGAGLWTCSCPSYRFTKGPLGTKTCKHVNHVQSSLVY